MRTPEILGLGEALIEFVLTESVLASNESSTRPLYSQGFGGDTSNAIISAARQGAKTGYISSVGDDPLGRQLIELWNAENVTTEHVRLHKTDPTGAYFIQPDASGRHYSYARRGSAASLYEKQNLPLQAIADARVLHTSALSMAISSTMHETVEAACHHAREKSTLVSFDTNLRLNLWDLDTARKAIEKVLPYADIVFPSDDEAEQICGSKTTDDTIAYFRQFGARIVVLTRGDKGAIIDAGGERYEIPPLPVKAVDSTGAGDSFAGAFLAYFLEKDDIAFAARCAAATAALTVSGYGAIDSIPKRDIVLDAAAQ